MGDRHSKRWWLVAGLLFTAFPASAENWRMPSEEFSVVEVVLHRITEGELDVGVVHPDENCKDFEDKVHPHDSIIVNGVRVRARTQCIGEGFAALMAKTDAGAKHIIREFKRSEKVSIEIRSGLPPLTFSAKGFTAAAEIYKNKRSGL